MKRLIDREVELYDRAFVRPDIEFSIDCELVAYLNHASNTSAITNSNKVKLVAFDVLCV